VFRLTVKKSNVIEKKKSNLNVHNDERMSEIIAIKMRIMLNAILMLLIFVVICNRIFISGFFLSVVNVE
jgi:hypothetical protein